ncbi:MAG: hypothetical protein GC134_05445 [Proteobacteria bacterium]|nr:hypothetical protein [Pseudomonadota bacterium]
MTGCRITYTDVKERLPEFPEALAALPQQPDGTRKAFGFSDPEDGQCHAVMGTFDADGNVIYLAAISIPEETRQDVADKMTGAGMTRMEMLPAIDMIAREREARKEGCCIEDTIPEVDPTQDAPVR